MVAETLQLGYVDETVARLGRRKDAVIPILQALQEHYRYLPEPALRRVCEISEITPSQIWGIATFTTSSAIARSANTSSTSAMAPPAT